MSLLYVHGLTENEPNEYKTIYARRALLAQKRDLYEAEEEPRSNVVFHPEIPHDFEKVRIRTDFALVRNLYLEADRLYDGKVEPTTDKIIRDYIEDHKGLRRITTYTVIEPITSIALECT